MGEEEKEEGDDERRKEREGGFRSMWKRREGLGVGLGKRATGKGEACKEGTGAGMWRARRRSVEGRRGAHLLTMCS